MVVQATSNLRGGALTFTTPLTRYSILEDPRCAPLWGAFAPLGPLASPPPPSLHEGEC